MTGLYWAKPQPGGILGAPGREGHCAGVTENEMELGGVDDWGVRAVGMEEH